MASESVENGSGGSVILYTSKFSVFGWRPQLALVEKGIPFTTVVIDLDDKPKELLEANPVYGKVPTMVHNGTPICESVVILEYIEEAWPDRKPRMPRDALGKSRARFWTDYIYKGYEKFFQMARAKPGSPVKDAAAAEVPKFLKGLESAMVEYSVDGPFFVGDSFGYLDVVLVPLTRWIRLVELLTGSPIPGPTELPRLHKWVEATNARKSVEETLPSENEAFERFASIIRYYQEKHAAAGT